MIQLNLLPEVKKEFLRARAMRRKAISLSILATIVSVGLLAVLGVILVGQYTATRVMTSSIESRAEQLANIENIDEYLTIQAQLAEIDNLHAGKTNASRLTDILPRLNPNAPNSVRFSNVDLIVDENTIIFQGGTRNVSALTTFKDTLDNAQLSYNLEGEDTVSEPLFENIEISEYGYSVQANSPVTAVGFKITAVYNTKIFETAAKNVRVRVPNKETTQSVIAAPNVTFEANAGNLEGNDE